MMRIIRHNRGLLYYNDAYHLVLNGNEAGTDYRISINTSSTKLLQSESELTDGGDNATLSTKITELDQFGDNPLQGGEVIEITGTDHNGNAIAQVNLNITSYTTVSHLIDEINDAFDGIAVASFENGKLYLLIRRQGTATCLSIWITTPTAHLPNCLCWYGCFNRRRQLNRKPGEFYSADFTQTQLPEMRWLKWMVPYGCRRMWGSDRFSWLITKLRHIYTHVTKDKQPYL